MVGVWVLVLIVYKKPDWVIVGFCKRSISHLLVQKDFIFCSFFLAKIAKYSLKICLLFLMMLVFKKSPGPMSLDMLVSPPPAA